MKKRAHFIMHGGIEGVGFRFLAKQKAIELRLKGYCKAFERDEIIIEVEGDEENIDKFIKYIEKGVSPQASITSYSVAIFDDLKGFKSMESDIV